MASLRKQNPALFDAWTVATLLNAKSWGLSFGPGTYDSFDVTIQQCAAANPEKGDSNPCTSEYTVPNQAARYSITPVPMSASIRPPSPAPASGSAQSATVVPDLSYSAPTGQTIDRSLFGIHAPANWFSDLESGVEGPTDEATIPDVPVGYLRLWDTETTWADIEPVKGQFDWRKLERQIQTAQITDSRVMLVLGGTPAWAGDGSPQSPPTNIADWRNYVKTVACRLGPSISSYEVWNEANLTTFWKGTPTQMADLTAAAFDEIRACNPSALVVAANTTSRATGSFGTFYPEYLAQLKARNWPVDAYSVHSYPTASGGANDRIKGIGQFKTMLALAGAPQTTIFDTEINYGLAGLGEGKIDLTGEKAMALISRTYIDSARYGFASTFWFVWTASPDSKFGIQFTRQADAEKTAWRTTYDWLVGAQFQKCLENDQALIVCQFSKGGGNFSIVWHGDVGSASIKVSSAVLGQLGSRICDLSANCNDLESGSNQTIGFKPVRIDGAPLPAGTAPSAPTQEASGETPLSANPPATVDVEVVYGVSNKADAVARWFPAPGIADPAMVTYSYSWEYCTKGKCTRFAGGTVRGKYTTSIDLRKGPGDYRFSVRSTVCSLTDPNRCSVSAPATADFTVLSTRATPPSNVTIAVGAGQGLVKWSPPNVAKGLIKEYEIQVRSLSNTSDTAKAGAWVAAGTAKGNASAIPLKGATCAGPYCQARVRTVMKSGLTSIFALSSPTAVGQYSQPLVDLSLQGPTFHAVGAPLVGGYVYPSYAYQLRYRVGDGDWVNATVLSASDGREFGALQARRPLPGTLNAPYLASVVFSGPQVAMSEWENVTVEARGIGPASDYLVPSDWTRMYLDTSTSSE